MGIGYIDSMPTVLLSMGFAFKVLTRDHDPAHVHVYRNDTTAKIGLGSEEVAPYLILNLGMSTKDLRKALEIIEQNQTMFLIAWRKYHG